MIAIKSTNLSIEVVSVVWLLCDRPGSVSMDRTLFETTETVGTIIYIETRLKTG